MKMQIEQLIDFAKVDALLEGFNKSTGFVTAILDLEGRILSKSGWRTICTDFHRVNPLTSVNCTYSDTILAGKMAADGNYHFYKCLNGLVDVAVPIRINGEHLANLFSGQFFFEPPDKAYFMLQAQKFGFDEQQFLEALEKVPVVSEEKVKIAMDFLLQMTQFISELALQKKELTDLSEQLSESREKFKTIFDAANVGKSLTLISGEINVNKAFCDMLGYSREELQNKKWQELTPEEDIPAVQAMLDLMVQGKKDTARFDKRYICKDKSIVWGDVNVTVQRDQDRNPLYFITTVVDITESKQADEKLRANEHLYHGMFEKSQAIKLLIDPSDGSIVDANTAAAGFYGYSVTELKSMKISDINTLSVSEVKAEMSAALAEKRSYFNFSHRLANGRIRDVEVHSSPLNYGGRDLLYSIIHDITKRKHTEKALSESEEKFRQVFEASNVGKSLTLISGEVIPNQALSSLLGYSLEELSHKKWQELTPPEDIAAVDRHIAPLLEGKLDAIRFNKRFISKNGAIVWGDVSVAIRRDAAGKPMHFITSVVDITEQVRMEKQLLESESRYRFITENIGDVIWVLDPASQRFTYVSPSVVKLRGYTSEEVMAQPFADSLTPESLQKVTELMSNRLRQFKENPQIKDQITEPRTAVSFVHQADQPCKDGSIVQTEVATTWSRKADGQLQIIGVSRDITERKRTEMELIEAKEKAEENNANVTAIIEGTSDSIWAFDRNFNILYINHVFQNEFQESFGVWLEVGSNLVKALPESLQPFWKMRYDRVLAGEQFTIEDEVETITGKLFIQVTFNPIVKKGVVIGGSCFGSNITERKHIEEIQAQHVREWQTTFDGVDDAIWLLNSEQVILRSNKKAEEFFGLSIGEMLGKRCWEVAHGTKEPIHSCPVKRMRQNLKREQYDLLIGERYFEVTVDPILDAVGNFTGAVHIVSDITKRKQAEEALKESYQMLAQFIKNSPIYAYLKEVTADESRVLWASDNFIDMIGVSGSEMTGKTMKELFPAEFAEKIQQEDWEVVLEGKMLEVEEFLNDRIFLTIKFPLTIGGKRVLAGYTIDITDRKRNEEILIANEALLRGLNAQKDKFFAIISHDLKSPFNAILALSQQLAEQMAEKDYEEIEEYAKIILQSSERAVNLLMNLLEWSQLQTGRTAFNPEDFDLVEIIKETLSIFEEVAAQKSISLDSKLPAQIMLNADLHMVSTVLRNLVNNAIKFSFTGNEVVILAESNQQEATVCVQDRGMGIPAERLAKLFRIDENESTVGTANEKGSGLGLILCKEFVEKHGGRIWADSKAGEGSSFYFTLPFHRV